ncbi:MAG: hypothetical protein WA323_00210 [Candidatus Nitrosopolaris sp.]
MISNQVYKVTSNQNMVYVKLLPMIQLKRPVIWDGIMDGRHFVKASNQILTVWREHQ